jgi:hypothetical protein
VLLAAGRRTATVQGCDPRAVQKSSADQPSSAPPRPHPHPCRWITLALTQEFAFPDAVRLWDSLLSDPAGRTDCLLRLCTAMLLHVRQELLEVRGAQAGCTNRRRSAVLQPDKWRRPRGLLWGSAAVWRLDSHRRALRQPCRATLPPT